MNSAIEFVMWLAYKYPAIYNEVINSDDPFETAHDLLMFMIDLFHNAEDGRKTVRSNRNYVLVRLAVRSVADFSKLVFILIGSYVGILGRTSK